MVAIDLLNNCTPAHELYPSMQDVDLSVWDSGVGPAFLVGGSLVNEFLEGTQRYALGKALNF